MSQEETCKECEHFVPNDYWCELFEQETDEYTKDCPEFSHKNARAVTMNKFGDGEA